MISDKLDHISKKKRRVEGYAHHISGGLVSVCVPNFNKASYLEECLNSVANQTYKNKMEIIIVDDKSSDDSWIIIQNFKRNYPDLKIITHQLPKRCGTAWAQNIAYFFSQGEYIMNMDSDDVISPDKVKAQVEFMKANELDACGTNFTIFNSDVNSPVKHDGGYWLEYDSEKIKEKYEKNIHCTCFGSMMFHHKVIEACGGMNKKYIGTEDYEMVLRVSNMGFKIGNVREALYHYRYHPGQRSRLFHAK